ncbi:MAG: response regulator [Chloroflexi bacterium]|nr:response regulator [Chloroflexota bacterium]
MAARRILVAEDQAAIRDLLRIALEEQGYVVDEANNGVEALVRLREHRPNLVILDLLMPVVDGFTFVQAALHEPNGKDVPILVLSAVPSLFDVTATLPVRMVMSKPFDIDVLLGHVHRLTAPSGPGGAGSAGD